jgi:uncharacterized membrane protein YidH (DUF202 family)
MKTKIKINKRDLLFFLIGIGVMILIDLIWNWKENVRDFREGFEEGYNSVRTEEITE